MVLLESPIELQEPASGHADQPAPAQPSLSIVLEQMQRRVETQSQQIATLDTKANFVLTAATVLGAAFGSFGTAILPGQLRHPVSLEGLIILLSLLIYSGLVLCIWQAYRVRTFKHAPEPEELLKYADKSQDETMYDLANAMCSCLRHNQTLADKKAEWVVLAERLFVAEAIWIAAIVLGRLIW